VTFIIPLAYGSLGAFALVLQTVLLREAFVVAAGNEVAFGAAMAGWLVGVALGSLAAAAFPGKRGAAAFAWAALAMCLAAVPLLAAARGLFHFTAAGRGALLPLADSLLAIPLIMAPAALLSGFAFPLAAWLPAPGGASPPRSLARAYAWEALGAMAAGLLYSFVLAGRSAPLAVIGLFALPLLLSAALAARPARAAGHSPQAGRAPAAACALAAVLVAVSLLSGLAGRLESRLNGWRWQGIGAGRLVEVRDTRFQNLQLGLLAGQHELYANGQLAAVFPDEAANELLAAQLLSQHPRPRDILVIGDVVSGLARQLLRYPLSSLTAVEIDPAYARLVRRRLGGEDLVVLRDPRLRLRYMDGRRFALLAARRSGNERQRYDLVFINQPDAWTAHINRYYTREFFLDIDGILAPGGVAALRLASAENTASEIALPYTAAVFHTLKSVLPAVAVLPGAKTFLFASRSAASVSVDPGLLAGRYQALAPPPARLAPVFASLYPPERTAFFAAALERNQPPALNRDDRPIAYFLGSRLLGWHSGSRLSGLYAHVSRLSPATALAALALLLLPLAVVALSAPGARRRARTALLASAAAGFAGLACEITALFAFQSSWGYAYQALGALIALFMLGLAIGAAGAGRWVDRRSPTPEAAARRLALVMALMAGIGPLLPLLHEPGRPGQLLLAAWLGSLGVLVGTVLPLGLRLRGEEQAGAAAGILNAGDTLGGTVGSLVMAAFFLPLLGTASSLLLVSLPAVIAGALLAALAGRDGENGRSG
jgi:spermidine synthase